MTSATRFLTAFAQAISAMGLYREGHPARDRALDHAYQQLVLLQEESPRPRLTFLADEIVLDSRPLRELKTWDWGARLAAVGVQRLEFTGPVERGDFEVFLDDVHQRLAGTPVSSALARQERPTSIRYGLVGVEGEEEKDGTPARGELAKATLSYTFGEEMETVDWLHEELKADRGLHLLEAEAIVRSLSVAMHGDQAFLIPLLRLKRFDQYTTTHALNVSVLAMALAEFIGLPPKEVRMFGISGLLHDLGKVTIPDEILNKPGKLTDQERLVMNSHTVAGARMIMEAEEHLDLAAVVAYEHHIRLDGGGYPSLAYPRPCHQASNLVHVCDVFDALRTDRPYRGAWKTARVLQLLEEGAGTEFDRDLALAFIQMMRRWENRIAEVPTDRPELSLGSPGDEASGPTGEGGAPGPAAVPGAREGGGQDPGPPAEGPPAPSPGDRGAPPEGGDA